MDDTKSRKTLRERDGEASAEPRPESLPHGTTKDQIAEMESEGQAQQPVNDSDLATPSQDDREGATDEEVGDQTGPGADTTRSPNRRKTGAASPSAEYGGR